MQRVLFLALLLLLIVRLTLYSCLHKFNSFLKEANSVVLLPEEIWRGCLQIPNNPLLHLTRRISSAHIKCFLQPQGLPECSMKLVYSFIFSFSDILVLFIWFCLLIYKKLGSLGHPVLYLRRRELRPAQALVCPIIAGFDLSGFQC